MAKKRTGHTTAKGRPKTHGACLRKIIRETHGRAKKKAYNFGKTGRDIDRKRDSKGRYT